MWGARVGPLVLSLVRHDAHETPSQSAALSLHHVSRSSSLEAQNHLIAAEECTLPAR
jgi:hypothetical protein